MLAAGLVFLVLVGVLAMLFPNGSRAIARRASFGATQSPRQSTRWRRIVPVGIDPAAWRQAVADTHQALIAVTASESMDQTEMSVRSATK